MPKVVHLRRFSARPGLIRKSSGYKRVERCIARWKAEDAAKAEQEQSDAEKNDDAEE